MFSVLPRLMRENQAAYNAKEEEGVPSRDSGLG
jgi:hypothetical protein